jgi:hypothetical protein
MIRPFARRLQSGYNPFSAGAFVKDEGICRSHGIGTNRYLQPARLAAFSRRPCISVLFILENARTAKLSKTG